MTKARQFTGFIIGAVLALAAMVVMSLPASAAGYGLLVDGVEVTSSNAADICGDGIYSYKPSTKTLSVKGTHKSSTTAIENKSVDGLRISVEKGSTVNGPIVIRKNTTITGDSTLTVKPTGSSGIVVYDNSTLTLDRANMRVVARFGIGGSAGSKSALKIKESYLDMECSLAAISGFSSGVTLEQCFVSKPETFSIANGGIFDGSTGSEATRLLISNACQYELEISGTVVTEKNRLDILENGIFEYDYKTNTLLIKGDYTEDDIYVKSNIDDLTIKTVKDSRLTACFTLNADTTVTGAGVLTFANNGSIPFGKNVDKKVTLTFKKAKVVTETWNFYCDDRQGGCLVFDGSYIHAKGTEDGGCFIRYGARNTENFTHRAFVDSIELKNCELAGPENAVLENNNIYIKGTYNRYTPALKDPAGNVIIRPKLVFDLKYPSYTYTGKPIELDKYITLTANGKALTKDKDYTLSYENNTKVGYKTATVKVTLKGDHMGELSKEFTIKPAKQSKPTLTTKNGAIKVSWKEDASAVGYQVIYSKDPGVPADSETYHSTTVTGKGYVNLSSVPEPGETWYVKVRSFITSDGTTKGTRYGSYSAAASITVKGNVSKASIPYASYTYTGKEIKPAVTVKDSDGKKLSSADYTVTYTDNIKVGKATIKISGKGDYQGTITKTFVIKPKPGTLTLTAGKGAFRASWTKNTSATGYEIVYSKDKSFKSGVYTYNVSKNTTTSANFSSKPASGETWYVKYRAYVTVGGKKYGNFSSVKTIKTK